mmetsp:Transcript_16990/g.47043  ORF Transcript_16990/g.47043 Transcript_16990/m.47043 type:complete len:361 (+) Transcript_16990:88-1170(+)
MNSLPIMHSIRTSICSCEHTHTHTLSLSLSLLSTSTSTSSCCLFKTSALHKHLSSPYPTTASFVASFIIRVKISLRIALLLISLLLLPLLLSTHEDRHFTIRLELADGEPRVAAARNGALLARGPLDVRANGLAGVHVTTHLILHRVLHQRAHEGAFEIDLRRASVHDHELLFFVLAIALCNTARVDRFAQFLAQCLVALVLLVVVIPVCALAAALALAPYFLHAPFQLLLVVLRVLVVAVVANLLQGFEEYGDAVIAVDVGLHEVLELVSFLLQRVFFVAMLLEQPVDGVVRHEAPRGAVQHADVRRDAIAVIAFLADHHVHHGLHGPGVLRVLRHVLRRHGCSDVVAAMLLRCCQWGD